MSPSYFKINHLMLWSQRIFLQDSCCGLVGPSWRAKLVSSEVTVSPGQQLPLSQPHHCYCWISEQGLPGAIPGTGKQPVLYLLLSQARKCYFTRHTKQRKSAELSYSLWLKNCALLLSLCSYSPSHQSCKTLMLMKALPAHATCDTNVTFTWNLTISELISRALWNTDYWGMH